MNKNQTITSLYEFYLDWAKKNTIAQMLAQLQDRTDLEITKITPDSFTFKMEHYLVLISKGCTGLATVYIQKR